MGRNHKQLIGKELNQRVVVLDIETTGLMPQRGHRIIEIGAVALQENQIVDEFHSLIRIQRHIPRNAQKIHGISDEMLQECPGAEIVLPQFHDFIHQSKLVAHNAKFDLTFLRYELARLGLSLTHPAICTLKMSRRHYPFLPNHKLETVARYLLGELPTAIQRHRALDDAKLAAKIWMVMNGK
ncbi:DNA polymerase-3 subunit epsilon [Syntrophus gentianae]|uniref:DNA polymerase-3 subunit epsilon n=1 Tax=Syntrophus gentianae TaxID=43775 RepID=A0A1H8A7M5_9BACT|nr:3'-5' exonuclease [Syntrophus gentianae]SEM66700.1 DNA polymerase-3 subunit epsilon [Syntrophus gentianae]